MPRLPDVDTLGARPVPRSRRSIASNPRAGAVGDAVSGLGNELAGIGGRMFEKEDRLAYAAAKTAMLKADVATRQELENDPDYETWETRYTDRMTTAREQAAGLIRSKSDRALFEEDAGLDIVRGNAALSGAANARRRDARLAVGMDALSALSDVGQDASDDATREATIANANEIIAGMVERGDIDAVRAGELSRGWVQSYIVQRAETMQQAGDIDGAAAFIDVNAGRLDPSTETRLRRQVGEAAEHRETLTLAEEFVHGASPVVSTPAAPAAPLPRWASPVAAELQRAGYSGNVVAGFLGNFEVEGGHGGALGDGGTASGIAQWRHERRANFKRKFGKEPHEATAAEQAQFVVWEMQNPQAAGMTVAQRDAILAARTPEEAAALIDQHYERSSGAHRERRIQAARSYHGGEAAQAHDLENIYASINERAEAEGWTPEKTESVKAQAARLVDRDEQLLNRQYRTAADEAAQAIAAMPNGLTDITQIPASIRSRMDPTDIAKLETDIREERRARADEARAEAQARRAVELQFMQRFEPAKFRRLNPLEEARNLSPEKFNSFMMDYLEANEDKPFDPTGIRGGINSEIEFQMRHGQLDLDDKEKIALFDFMEAQLSVIQGKKGFITRSDYTDAFRTAMRPAQSGGKPIDAATYEVLSEVPENIEAEIVRNWRGRTPPTKGQIISVWMQAYGGRSE